MHFLRIDSSSKPVFQYAMAVTIRKGIAWNYDGAMGSHFRKNLWSKIRKISFEFIKAEI